MSGPDDKSTATIKFGDKFDAPWFVAYGNPRAQREQLLEFAGLDAEATSELTLAEVIVQVASDAQAKWATRSTLGGSQQISRDPKPAAGKAEAEAKAEESDDPNAHIREAIADAADIDALKLVFGKNAAAFTADATLQAAFLEKKNSFN